MHVCTKDLTQRTRDLSNRSFLGLIYLKNAEIKILMMRTTDFVRHENKFLTRSLVYSFVHSFAFIHSFVHFVRLFVHSLGHFFVRSLARLHSGREEIPGERASPNDRNFWMLLATTCCLQLVPRESNDMYFLTLGARSCTSVKLPQSSVYAPLSSQSPSIDPGKRVPRFFVNRAFCPCEEI